MIWNCLTTNIVVQLVVFFISNMPSYLQWLWHPWKQYASSVDYHILHLFKLPPCMFMSWGNCTTPAWIKLLQNPLKQRKESVYSLKASHSTEGYIICYVSTIMWCNLVHKPVVKFGSGVDNYNDCTLEEQNVHSGTIMFCLQALHKHQTLPSSVQNYTHG